jgi:hypothetical protein
MTAEPDGESAAGLDLALFQVGGVRFGVEAGQLASTAVLQGPAAVGLRWFHEILGYGEGAVRYRNPVVLNLRSARPGVIVDGLGELVRVPLAELRPFPPLAEAAARARGLWAVARRRDHLVLLVDFQLLAGGGPVPAAGPWAGTP